MTRAKFKLTLIRLFLLTLAAERMSAQSTNDELIRPVLATNCYACPSSKLKTPMGGLVLDTRSGMLKGGDSGPCTRQAG